MRFSEVSSKVNWASIGAPSVCPLCGVELVIEEAFLTCPNSKCVGKVRGNIKKFTAVIDAKNVGDETIDALVGLGLVRCPADLYTLTEADFCRIPRKGPAHFKKMRAGLEARKSVSVEKFFGSLNVSRAGEGIFSNLVQAGFSTYSQIMSLTVTEAVSAPRVGLEAAQAIVKFLAANREDIERLASFVQVGRDTPCDGPLSGKSFLITGTLSRPKAAVYAEITAKGGTVASSVTGNLTYLVCESVDSSSSKAVKARAMGVQLITEGDLSRILSA